MDIKEILQHGEEFRYMMLDRMRGDCEYYLGNGGRHAKYLWGENEVDHIVNLKTLWNSFSEDKKPEWLPYEKILEYEQEMCPKAILVERVYKGEFERFALTPEEFQREYGEGLNIIARDTEGCWSAGAVHTVKPMVHIWFCEVAVGDDDWQRFFTDMADGLSKGDLEAGNLAYVREDLFGELKKYFPKAQPSLDNLIEKAESGKAVRENNSKCIGQDIDR